MKKQVLQKTKHWAFTLIGMTVFLTHAAAQLSGIKTIPGTYASVAAAISALNANGVGPGGVTFNINAGYTETITAPLSVTATGTTANPIIFQKSGTGNNPLITAYTGGTGTPNTAVQDGIWNLAGSDYVTINGIDLRDNPANTATGSMMEYGYGLFKASSSNGCKNNIIKNCVITLNRNNSATAAGPAFAGSCGIVMLNSTATNVTTSLSVIAAGGSSSNNAFYSNTIQNCNNGIVLNGFAAPYPYTLADLNNDIGGNGSSTGNTIINFGGGVSALNASAAVVLNDQWNYNVSFNIINNNNGSGVNHVNTLRGIWTSGSLGASGTINNNTLTLSSSGINTQLTVIENGAGSKAIVPNTISINNNSIVNCSYANATSGGFYGIYVPAAPANIVIRGNSFSNNNTAAISGTYSHIYYTVNTTDYQQLGLTNSAVISNNTITNTTFTAQSTSVVFRAIQAAATAVISRLSFTIDTNTIQNITYNGTGDISAIFFGITGTRYFYARNNTITSNNFNTTSGTIYGFNVNYGMMTASGPQTGTAVKNIQNNVFSNITRNGGTGTTYGIFGNALSAGSGNTITIANNQFTNIVSTGGTNVIMVFESDATTTSPYGPQKLVYNNLINNVTCGTGTSTMMSITGSSFNTPGKIYNNTISNITGTGSITGMGVISTALGTQNYYDNIITGISSTLAVTGLSVAIGDVISNVYGNKIYDLTGTLSGSYVTGITTAAGPAIGTSTFNIYNNLMGDLKLPNSNTTNQFNGITIAQGTTINLHHNTVVLNATSTGANFGTNLLNVTATPGTVVLRNNIFVNTSTPNGTGISTVLRRASTVLTNFSTTSQNNLYYAGPVAYNRILLHDGTNADSTLAQYKTRVGPVRDSMAISENVSFQSLSGTNPNFLKPSMAVATGIESGAIPIAGLTDAFGSAPRPGNPAYAGLGAIADLGAIEGDYIGTGVAMTHDSTTVQQITGSVAPGTSNVQVLAIKVYVKNAGNALQATSFKFKTTGTTSLPNIAAARIYGTGSSSTFATTSLYGSVNSPGTTFYINGSRALNTGVNYFWLVYDVSGTVSGGNLLDATLDSIVLSGTNYAMTSSDTLGSRTVKPRMSGNYDIGVGKTAPHFASINAAFSDLAALGVSGPVTLTLTDALYNVSLTNMTSASVNVTAIDGTSPTNTVTLRPAAATTVTISENTANPIFNLSGVNYFIIDGRQGGSGVPKSLTIQNTNGNGNAVRFINDASYNTLQYTVFKAQNTNVFNAVINWLTGLVTGNDYNTVTYCDIADNGGSNIPVSAIYSGGSSDCPLTRFNDYNSVTNCNIYNFGNPSGESDAFRLNLGNNYWTITGNSIYQTTARSSNVSYVFNLNNGGYQDALNGMVISGNYIGGSAPQCGGTPWTTNPSACAVATYFVMGSDVTSKFSNNTVSNFSIASTAAPSTSLYGGILSLCNLQMGKMDIDSNTYGSMTDPNAISITGGNNALVWPINFGAFYNPGIYSISNNKIAGVRLQPGAGNVNSFAGITTTLAGSGFTINIRKNTIGGKIPNSILADASTGTGTQYVRGIVNTSGATLNIDSNIIQNLNNLNSATGAATQVLGISSTAGENTITNNTIDSFYTATPQSGFGMSASVLGIGCTSTAGSTNIGMNTIFGLQNAAASGAVQVTGIYYSGGTAGLLQRNLVYSLTGASNTAAYTGLSLAAGSARVINNMIRMGIDGAGNTMTPQANIYGINKTGGNVEAYFNSVYVGGNITGPSLSTYAFNRTASGTDIVMNNVFANYRSNAGPGTGGGHYAIGLNNMATLTLNANIYYASGNGDSIGQLNNTGILTLSDWKTVTVSDAISVSGTPGFVNPAGTSANVNLHISGATPVEAAGVAISGAGADVDFDGDIRSAFGPTDIGADAGNFTQSDLSPAAIDYIPLVPSSSTGNRVVTATITDQTGIYLSGTLRPRIYFKKLTSGTYVSTQGVFVSGTKTNSVWNFTINTSMLSGGVSVSDTVYYYVVAQDSSLSGNNLGSMPSGASGTDVNSMTTHPAAPNVYYVIPIVNGTLNVGVGQTFPTLTGTDGVFNYINNSEVNGNITIQITSDIREPGTIGLNQTNETGVGGYRIRVVPDMAVEHILSSASATGMIRLNGADRVTFDGRFGGSGRYLKLIDTSGANLPAFTMQNDAHRDTLMYCTILGNNSATGDVLFGACTTGTGNDSNAVMYCLLGGINRTNFNTNTNISCAGASAGTENSENTIAYNEFFQNRYGAINLNGTATGNNWNIYSNTFYMDSIQNPTAADHWVVYVQGGGGHTIRKNNIGGSMSGRIGDAYTISTTGTSRNVYGINVNSSSPLSITIDSNTIGNLINKGTTVSTAVGLYGIYATNALVNINANTIGNLGQAADSLQSTNGNTYGIYIAGGVASVQNNTIGNLYNRHAGAIICAGIYMAGGVTNTNNNTIHDIIGVSTSSANFAQLPSGITMAGGTHTTDKNTVYNITNANGGTAAYLAAGISTTGGNFSVVSRNRIYSVRASGTGTGTSAPQVFGIYNAGITHAYNNNQVSIGSDVTNETRVFGLYDNSTSGNTNYYYNSVLVSGTTGSGINHSYGIYRNSSAPVLIWNNIAYNGRTTFGTGYNYAFGTANQSNIARSFLNYNLFVVNDTNKVSEYGTGTPTGAWAHNNTITSAFGTYNTNWIESVSNLPADSLFINATAGNTGTRNDRTHAWYVNGKGCALAGQGADFNSSSPVRSVLISSGSTDIGSMEITPTTQPALAKPNKAPALNDSTFYYVASRVVAKVNWGSAGTLPSAVDVRYYSGTNPTNTPAGRTYMNAYWNMTATGGSGYNSTLTLMQDSAAFGTVNASANLQMVRYNNTGTQWVSTPTTVVNNTAGSMSSTGITTFGIFTGTDKLTNPLPVTLVSFAATKSNDDVQLTWNTASEINSEGFGIEYSADGKTFEQIGFVKSKGSTNTTTNYAFTDKDAFGKNAVNILYYRLRQQDADGSIAYSNTRSVTSEDFTPSMNVYPNPFADHLTLSIPSQINSTITIRITDIRGKEILTLNKQVAAGMNNWMIEELNALQQGVYILSVQTEMETKTLKLIKQ